MENFLEVKLKSDFLVVKETLTRIGIANRSTKVIIPSCYIVHRNGRYFIAHFKELLAESGHRKEIEQRDIDRRDAIATLLDNWGLIEIMNDDKYQITLKEKIFVLPHSEKENYEVIHKFNMD